MSKSLDTVEVIDAQVHVYDTGQRSGLVGSPFDNSLEAPLAISGSQMIEAMDAAGVDAAVLVSPSHYGWDNSYALGVAAEFPDRFRVVGLLDHNGPDIGGCVEQWSAMPQAVGMRLPITTRSHRDQLMAGRYEPCLTAAARCGVPVCVYAPDFPRELAEQVKAHPNVRFVLDHFGLDARVTSSDATSGEDARSPDPMSSEVSSVLSFATFPNVAVKLSGGPRLSARPYPFEDLLPIVGAFIECFGPDRLMWGTDWTRVENGSYPEGVRYLLETDQLSRAEKAAIMGGTLRALFGWS